MRSFTVEEPVERLRSAFGRELYAAAERLVESGRICNVRILESGRIVTGIAADAQADAPGAESTTTRRVYIRRASQQAAPDGECSCGERSPCIHVAAVAIAAARLARESPVTTRRAGAESPRPTHAPARSTLTEQRLCYVFDAADLPEAPQLRARPVCDLQVCLWVGRTIADAGRIDPDAVRYSPRVSNAGGEYPRYVDGHDREILRALSTQSDSPWRLDGAAGMAVLQQAVATGRAFWRSLHREPLRRGNARPLGVSWEILANGDQSLTCEISPTTYVLLNLEPAIYIDPAENAWGTVETPWPLPLLRRYSSRAPVAAEQVAALNEQIAAETGAASFPRLRDLRIGRQALLSLRPRLQLSAGVGATLHFIYNGQAVDSRLLRDDRKVVRRMDDDLLCEIDRDRDAEQRLRTQLDEMLPNAQQDARQWLAFMLDAASALQAQGWEIVVDERFAYRIAGAGEWYADLCTNRRDGWFDLRFGVVVDGQPVNLLPALVSYLQGESGPADGSHYRIGERVLMRLEDGRYLPVAMERIQRIAETLVELLDRDALNPGRTLSLPLAQASRLAQVARELGDPLHPSPGSALALRSNDDSLLALLKDLDNFRGIQPLPAPAHFRATLRRYQQEGLGWLQFLRRYRLGGVLADDMGLGKTVQTLAHLSLEKQQGRLRKPALIVAPVSVIGNWGAELRRFAPDLRMLTLHGARRRELLPALDQADVVVTGYPTLQLDAELLVDREFSFVILDEAQMIKNPRAKASQAARALRAEHRLCLTGTPMENHLGELWSLFDFLQPGFLGDERRFQRQYRTPIEKNADRRRAESLTRRVAPFVLRRTKDAVAKELPPKTQIVEAIVLDERQRDFYDGVRLAMHQRVREAIQQQGLARSRITMLDALLKLRQACCDPRLVSDAARTEGVPSAKMDWLLTVLPELVAEGRRILLFSQFTSMLRLIEAAVTDLAIPCCMLTGETRERGALVERFQAGATPLFLISLKAGGVGLNLTAADTVIHYDPWWNPAAEAQATDRTHRIGQDQPVFVYKLIAQGTVEEKIMQLQADKQALADQLYTDANAAPAQLSAQDLEALFA